MVTAASLLEWEGLHVPTTILWFRRDLRLDDLPALHAALEDGDALVPLFVLDDAILGSSRMSTARLVYLCDALADLDRALRDRGSRLVVRRGEPRRVVPDLAADVGAAAVHCSGDHSRYSQRRDADVADALGERGAELISHDGVLIHPPGSITTGSGGTYRVFSPFGRSWLRTDPGRPLDSPQRLPGHDVEPGVLPVPADLGATEEDRGLPGGATAAQQRLRRFLDERAADYDEGRDRLAVDGTSRLSADLKYGCLSPRRILVDHLDRRRAGHDTFATELAWRDFYGHVMAAWPEVVDTEFDPRMRDLPWHGEDDDARAWCEGRTGYPIVDAAMRQLHAERWMHNRARMIVASFLCKDLLVDWRVGEAHFLRWLVDGDIANNNGGWQWAASTGTDAQPFFRVFNPVAQGERHDPDGAYVRRHLPELRDVPDRYLHAPWTMPPDEQEACGVVIGRDYPAPIVDHGEARRRALDWFEEHRRPA